MSRAVRLLGAVTLAVASVPLLGVGPASAATASEVGTTGAYYWTANPGTVEGTPLGAQKPFPDQAKGTDGVAEDDLAVAVTQVGSPDKWSALRWDLDALVPGSVVSKAVVVVPLSKNTSSKATPNASPNFVVACAIGSEGFADADAEPFKDAPSVGCKAFSAKATPVDGAYQFDVTALAQKWVDSNDGLALYPSEAGLATPFQQVFGGKSLARLTIAFAPPVVEAPLPVTPVAPVDTNPLPDNNGSAGFGGDSFVPPSEPISSGEVPLSAPEPVPAPGPAVAPQQPTVAVVRNVAAVATPMRFDAATWAAIAGGAVLLVLASLGLGAPARVAATAKTTARAGGVGEQLARRQRPVAPRPRAV